RSRLGGPVSPEPWPAAAESVPRRRVSGGAAALEQPASHSRGDACQCVSLLAGQGASLAMAGGYVLAEELDRSPIDGPTALAQYEGRLRAQVVKKQGAGRSIANWFVPDTKLKLVFRDLMLRVSTWPLAAAFARRGLAGDSVLADR